MPELTGMEGNGIFVLEVDGSVMATFKEAVITVTKKVSTKAREGAAMGWPTAPVKQHMVSLKRGVTNVSADLHDWRKMVYQGKKGAARRDVVIRQMDGSGNILARWKVHNAWPSKYISSDMNAKGNDVAIVSLELAHEGVDRVE